MEKNTPDLLELIRRAWRLIPSETKIDPAFAEEHAAWHLEASAVLRALEDQPAPARVVMPPFAETVLAKLARIDECFSDGQGADVGRKWFDTLTLLGLLKRAQVRPALWSITPEGAAALARLNASPAVQQANAAHDVLAERQRQIAFELWTAEHDDEHVCDEIAAFASFYAMPPAAREWDATSTGYGLTLGQAIIPEGWQAKTGDRRRELVIAGALILAEIERLDRAVIAQREATDHE